MDDERGATAESFHKNFPTNEAKRKRLDEVARSMGLEPMKWTESDIALAEGLGILEPEPSVADPSPSGDSRE